MNVLIESRTALGNISNRPAKKNNVAAKKNIKKGSKAERVPALEPALASPSVSDNSQMEISSNQSGLEAFSKHFLPENVIDIDKDDFGNPQLVSEYVTDIYKYMLELESKYPIRENYLKDKSTTARMRNILNDWLVQVHQRFHLLPETLYLTVAVIDRYLQEYDVPRIQLQLVGVTSMLLASKYEEMYAPEFDDFVYITDKAYTKGEIKEMEMKILRALDFSFGRPLPIHFLRRNSKAGEVDAENHTLAKYFMELCLPEYSLCHVKPSKVAAAACCLSLKILDQLPWNDTLRHYSTYSEEELKPVMKKMVELVGKANSSRQTAVRDKFTSSKFMRIASLPALQEEIIL